MHYGNKNCADTAQEFRALITVLVIFYYKTGLICHNTVLVNVYYKTGLICHNTVLVNVYY